MNKQLAKPLWLTAAPLIFLFLWSGGYATAKVGLEYTGPMALLVIRFGFVVIIMLAALLFLRPPMPKRGSDWAHLAIVGFLMQTVYFGFCYIAFSVGVGAGTLALLMSLQPILVGIGRKRWLGLAFGLIGTVIVITARSSLEPPTLIGLFAAMLALGGITAASLWEKRFGISHHPVSANLIGYSAGLIGILPFAFLLESELGSLNIFADTQWTWQLIAAVAYLVIGNSVIAVGLLLAMIRVGEVSRVSALFFLVPPLAALIAWVLLGELIPMIAWPGIILAAIGVYIATRP
ncbi:MAG: EamA family transporter [Gammaproteobacteria bacterium]|nr:EamA family transporter [Gammaproteobacteria bacterium]